VKVPGKIAWWSWGDSRKPRKGFGKGWRERQVAAAWVCARCSVGSVGGFGERRIPAEPANGDDTFSVLRDAEVRSVDLAKVDAIAGGDERLE
jgi:hypothetical protein